MHNQTNHLNYGQYVNIEEKQRLIDGLFRPVFSRYTWRESCSVQGHRSQVMWFSVLSLKPSLRLHKSLLYNYTSTLSRTHNTAVWGLNLPHCIHWQFFPVTNNRSLNCFKSTPFAFFSGVQIMSKFAELHSRRCTWHKAGVQKMESPGV